MLQQKGYKSWTRKSSTINPLTFDSKPSVGSCISSLIGGRALEHSRVLPPHVVDHQGPILHDIVPHGRDAVQGLAVSVPDNVGFGRALNIAWNLKLFPNLSKCLELKFSLEAGLLCNNKNWIESSWIYEVEVIKLSKK